MTENNHQQQLLQQAKRLLQQNRLDAAIENLQQLLQNQPKHRDALYYLAVCYRKQHDHTQAHQLLERLQNADPSYGRAYQELGHNYLAQNDAARAGEVYEKAVSLNSALISSWRALVNYRESQGNRKGALLAMQQAKWLAQLPSELVTVASLINEDKLYIAEQICRQYLQNNKHHIEGMRLLAEIGNKLQILDDAEFLLESCVALNPQYTRARMDYVQILHRRQKFQKSLEQAQALHQAEPNNIAFQVSLANQNQAVGNFDQAIDIYNTAIEQAHNHQPPRPAHTVYAARGHAQKTVGKTEQAIESYRQAYQSKPQYGDAYWSLANLKTYVFTDQELTQMVEQEQRQSISTDDKTHLCFALGKAYEDRQEYDQSFNYYQRGNQLRQQESRYQSAQIEQDFAAQKALFNADFFATRQHGGCQDPAPIFIVGLPRAGSTLLEQILASHSQVDGTLELSNIIGLAHRLGGRIKERRNYPSVLQTLSEQQRLKYGQHFIRDTQIHRQGAAFFIDKMPNNFRHIALIQLILPKAKIIDARRHPMACCFSGFKQLFAEGQEFSYGLSEIGGYYRAYVDLMNHWDKVLPNKILKVQHEDVLDDLNTQVRRILDFCELPFEQQCIDFHETARAVRTPSSEQVRQPIFKSSVAQWKNYQPHLSPLVTALGSTLQDY